MSHRTYKQGSSVLLEVLPFCLLRLTFLMKYSEILALKQGHYPGGKVVFDFVQVFIIGCVAPGKMGIPAG